MLFELLADYERNEVYEIWSGGDICRYSRKNWVRYLSYKSNNFSFAIEDDIKAYRVGKPSMKIYSGPHWKYIKQPGWIIVQSYDNYGWFETDALRDEYIEIFKQCRVANLLRR